MKATHQAYTSGKCTSGSTTRYKGHVVKIQIASDLHLECGRRGISLRDCIDDAGADVLALAGDIHRIRNVMRSCASWPTPVVYVHGNHDMYRRCYSDAISEARRLFAGTNIRYLEQDVWICDSVRFVGCCLWTDYAAAGPRGRALQAAATCANTVPIYYSQTNDRFTPWDALREHQESVEWLERVLTQPFAGKTVVVTHHAPHSLSLSSKRQPSLSDASYVSDLPRLIRWADLWIHGHLHRSVDYRYSRCRVVCNPAGASRSGQTARTTKLSPTNPRFDKAAVISI